MLLRALNRLPEDEKRAAAERVYREVMAPFGKEIEADEVTRMVHALERVGMALARQCKVDVPASLLDGQATRDTGIFKVSSTRSGATISPLVRIDGRPACAQFLGEAGSRGC